jgi:hypothetical protein
MLKECHKLLNRPTAAELGAKMREIYGVDLTTRSIRLLCHKASLLYRSPRSQQMLTEEDLKKRLAFATKYVEMPQTWFDSLCFSDEAYFHLNYGSLPGWSTEEQGPGTRHRVQHPEKAMLWLAIGNLGENGFCDGLLVRPKQHPGRSGVHRNASKVLRTPYQRKGALVDVTTGQRPIPHVQGNDGVP